MQNLYHQVDPQCSRGIRDMVAIAVAATERDHKDERKADTKGVGLKDVINQDLTQTGGPEKPEERQQRPPGTQLTSMPIPQPKPNESPKPNPSPAPRPAQTPTPRATSAAKGATT